RGEVTFAELDRRGAAIAAGMRRELGVGAGDGIAVMCRNHRGFIEALAAGSRLGADLLLLGTDFPAQQLAKVLERERPCALVHDGEFAETVEMAKFSGARIDAWPGEGTAGPTLDSLAAGPAADLG